METKEFKTVDTSVAYQFVRYMVFYALGVVFMFHFLAVFGIIISLTFPLVWLFLPNQIFCFFCLHQKLISTDGHPHCPVCNREVKTIFGPPLRSAVINTVFFFIISNICLLLFLIEINYLFNVQVPLPSFNIQKTAELTVTQSKTSQAEVYSFDIYIKSSTQAFNSAETNFKFDPTEIEVLAIVTDQSFADIFVTKEFSNTYGTINIAAGLPDPGYIGNGLLAKVLFKKLTTQSPGLSMLASSRVLANDGKGTNLLTQIGDTEINVNR